MLQSNNCYKLLNIAKYKMLKNTKYYTVLQSSQCYKVVNVTNCKYKIANVKN